MCMLKPEQCPTPIDRELLNARLTETLGQIGVVGTVISSEDIRQLTVGQYLPKEEEEK